MTKKLKTLHVNYYFKFHNMLQKALGDDLVYSLALDGDTHILAVSVHKSKTQKFNHDRLIQSVVFSDEDLQMDHEKVINTLIEMYKGIIVEKTEEDNAIKQPENYDINIVLHDKDGKLLQ